MDGEDGSVTRLHRTAGRRAPPPPYKLADAPPTHRPTDAELDQVGPHWNVKARFVVAQGTERMWVEVDRVEGDTFAGTLNSAPYFVPLQLGAPLRIGRRHVLEVLDPWDLGELLQRVPAGTVVLR